MAVEGLGAAGDKSLVNDIAVKKMGEMKQGRVKNQEEDQQKALGQGKELEQKDANGQVDFTA